MMSRSAFGVDFTNRHLGSYDCNIIYCGETEERKYCIWTLDIRSFASQKHLCSVAYESNQCHFKLSHIYHIYADNVYAEG